LNTIGGVVSRWYSTKSFFKDDKFGVKDDKFGVKNDKFGVKDDKFGVKNASLIAVFSKESIKRQLTGCLKEYIVLLNSKE
jgi:hypothetical protein